MAITFITANQARHKERKLRERVARTARDAATEPLLADHLDRARSLYLRSTSAKAAALLSVLPELERSPHRLTSLASAMDVLHFPRSPVLWRFKERSSGTLRMVCNFGTHHRTAHVMAKRLIHAQTTPGPHIFNWPRRGRDRAIAAIADALRSHGNHVLVADVSRCFEHVAVDAVYGLNLLPAEMIRNALDHRTLSFRRYGEIPIRSDGSPYGAEEVGRTRPRGLLEGSAASDALLAVLLDDLPSHFDEAVRLFVYGDNIVAVAREAGDISRAEATLIRHLAGCSEGPFILGWRFRVSPGEPFEHLGYQIWQQPDGRVEVQHSASNWLKAMKKLESLAGSFHFKTPEALAAQILNGFPAVTEEYRTGLIYLAEDELAAAFS